MCKREREGARERVAGGGGVHDACILFHWLTVAKDSVRLIHVIIY